MNIRILNEELKIPFVTDTINIMKYIAVNEIFCFLE